MVDVDKLKTLYDSADQPSAGIGVVDVNTLLTLEIGAVAVKELWTCCDFCGLRSILCRDRADCHGLAVRVLLFLASGWAANLFRFLGGCHAHRARKH